VKVSSFRSQTCAVKLRKNTSLTTEHVRRLHIGRTAGGSVPLCTPETSPQSLSTPARECLRRGRGSPCRPLFSAFNVGICLHALYRCRPMAHHHRELLYNIITETRRRPYYSRTCFNERPTGEVSCPYPAAPLLSIITETIDQDTVDWHCGI
jgi:hypothetical protein